MKLGIKFRLAALALGLALMGALIVGVILTSQQQASDVRARLTHVDLESFRLADRFRDAWRKVADRMRDYRLTPDSANWDAFVQAGHEFELWLHEQAPRLTTQRETETLLALHSGYDEFIRLARDFHAQILTSKSPEDLRSEQDALHEQTRRLSNLGESLARAHYSSRNELVSRANRNLTLLRMSVLWLLGLLFLFGIGLALLVYRQLIGPLKLQLQESQSLAQRHEKLASLGMLAAGVAHEIRNPLTAIKAALFIQQRKFRQGCPEKADVEVVEREILRLERIVNTFLQFARPEEPHLEPIRADLPLQEVEELVAPQLAMNGVQVVRESSAPLQIKADAGQIKQVLLNLVQNAADSMTGSGTITLRARHDRRRLTNGETDVVVLEVADTGKGIPPDVEKSIFDPFFTTKENGSGLGLSIAARIVERHGGVLQYQTQPNHGTTFGVVLPQLENVN
jgi:signal transduction histidine kinase